MTLTPILPTLGDLAALLAWAGSASAQAAVLIVALLALRALLGPRLSPGWRLALWLIVGLRLVTPIAVESRWSLAGLARAGLDAARPTPVAIAPPIAPRGPTVTVTYGPRPAAPAVVPPTPRPVVARPFSPLVAIWLAGVAILVARQLIAAARLRRDVARMRRVDDPELLRLAADCARAIGVRWLMRLVETDRLRCPAVCGIVRPTVLLPLGVRESLSRDELRLVLLHEFAHVRRDDVLIGAIAGGVRAIHWFNPLVWVAARAFRADRELACDAAVLARLADADARRAYGACVLRVVEQVAAARPHPASLGLFGPARSLRKRIDMIADRSASLPWRRRAGRSIVGTAAFVAIGCAAAAGEPATPAATSTIAMKPTTTRPATVDAGTQAAVVVDPARAALDAPMGGDGLTLNATPLVDALEFVRDVAKVPVFANWSAVEAAGIDRKVPVSLKVPGDVKRRKVLSLILDAAGGGVARLGYTVDDGVVTVSTQEDLARNVVTRTYDVRDLLVAIPDFDSRAATRPAQPTREEVVEQIVNLITASIAADSWKNNGGLIGAIQELGGQLIVTQTPEAQADIADLLRQLRGSRAVQVMVEARFMIVDPALVPTLLGKADATSAFLDDAQAAELIRKLAANKDAATLTAPRMTLFNGQNAFVTVNSPQPYIANYTMTQTAAGERKFEPVVAEASSGVTIDVQATASADYKFVTLTLGPRVTRLVRLDAEPFAGDASAKLTVQRPVLDTQEMRTTVSVPDRGTLLLSGGLTSDAVERVDGATILGGKSTTRPAPRQLLLLVKPTVIVQREIEDSTFPLLKQE